jgi:hypothetical protein
MLLQLAGRRRMSSVTTQVGLLVWFIRARTAKIDITPALQCEVGL